ncbi:MAG: class I SAM-dependent methyltransferase [Chitinophagaceae bacterium]
MRKPFQGVVNIIRFNWHFYALAIVLVGLMFIAGGFLPVSLRLYIIVLASLITTSTFISLLVSAYVYDFSGLYTLSWLDSLAIPQAATLININAGFDETSSTLADKYPGNQLLVYDFYDAEKHTEVSIERARKAYSAYPGTMPITTTSLPFAANFADVIFLILAAHEIRSDAERIVFFKELHRVLKPAGKIIVTEHLRDMPNFLAYNIGFFHFMSKRKWQETFAGAGYAIQQEIKLTPFITTFTLFKNGTAS